MKPNKNPAEPASWHTLTTEETLDRLETQLAGLSEAEAQRRLIAYGLNQLTPPRKRGPLVRFLVQFHNVLIYVLLGAALATAVLEHWVDTGVIIGVVLINAVVGSIQEGKAERALEAIRSLLSPQAQVLCEGREITLAAEELVPGDVVVLRPGDKVAADLRLIWTKNLRIDEAMLTGESVPIEKSMAPLPLETPLTDRTCMAYAGTLVTYGQGKGIVATTGDATEIGRISAMLKQVETLTTPLLRQMAGFGQWLTVAILAIAAATFAFGVLIRSFTPSEMLLAAVGLAVAAIPEGLPAIMTITLAIGVQRMARRNAIIRRLPAVETLGSVTTICSDKTGTLTRNEMTVQTIATTEHLLEVGGVGYDPHGAFSLQGQALPVQDHLELLELGRAALLCSDAEIYPEDSGWHLQGDPTEGALVVVAMKAGLDPPFERQEFPRIDLIPFESEHRFMATLHHNHAGHAFIYLKGAPEKVFGMCHRERLYGEDRPLNLPYWQLQVDGIAQRGHRPLAIAFKTAAGDKSSLDFSDVEGGLTLLGLVGITDPPREEAILAVRQCQEAGIRVKMITGDHALTARAIAKELGILGDRRGAEYDKRNLRFATLDLEAFARASPEHKLRFVQALLAMRVPLREESILGLKQLEGAGLRISMKPSSRAPLARADREQPEAQADGGVLTGAELEALSDEDLRATVMDVDVFARAAPETKLRLVKALQARGEVVAMTGDGVNDAPALKRADIGVAMGQKGTEVAKEAAEMVLADNNFASIAHAVEEGRTVYDNLKKAIVFILPTNGGEAFTLILAILIGDILPITPLQILWVNMATAVTLALSLAFEPPEPDVMQRSPRDSAEPILSPFLVWRIAFVSLILVAGTFGLYHWVTLQGASVDHARTVAVNTLVMFEVFYLLNTRYIYSSVLSFEGLLGNRWVLLSILAVIALQLLFTYAQPMQYLFATVRIEAQQWLWIVLVASTVFVLVEIEKSVLRLFAKRHP